MEQEEEYEGFGDRCRRGRERSWWRWRSVAGGEAQVDEEREREAEGAVEGEYPVGGHDGVDEGDACEGGSEAVVGTRGFAESYLNAVIDHVVASCLASGYLLV